MKPLEWSRRIASATVLSFTRVGGVAMTFRVRIFCWNSARSSNYLGEHDLNVKPAIGKPIEFRLNGNLRSGRVKDIAPSNWDPHSALIPAVHVEWCPVERSAEQRASDILHAAG